MAVPPVAGGVIGYFTNDLAIRMLFRPYRAIYLGGRKLPFTPGLIPSNQDRLARKISDAILGSLLTPSELQKLTRKLLETDRVQATILWLLQLALDQLQQDKNQKTAKILASILRDLLGESLPRLIRVLARQDDFLEPQLNQIFDQVIIDLQLSEEQAQQLVEWLFDVVLPPNVIRQAIVDFLTDRNIQIIDDSLRDKTSGTYWVIANLFGLKNALLRLRSYCLDERTSSNNLIYSLIQDLNIQLWLREELQNLSLQNLPVVTVRRLRKTLRDSVRSYLRDRGGEFLQNVSQSVDWDRIVILILSRLQNSAIMDASLELVSEELALVFERYLERDLENVVAQAIPILNLDQVIVQRVRATSPRNLEAAIQNIVRNELQAIVNLGGILGGVIGLLQSLLFFLQLTGAT
ncbi:MAG: DUF445 family protein [Cyanobacteria bacterium P01_H01_bin.121]